MSTTLIVANQTLGGDALTERIRATLRDGDRDFYVVVPATPPKDHLTWTEGEARTIAAERLAACLARLREDAIVADGEVGDANPVMAVEDTIRHHEFDSIIVATLPAGVSRWLKMSLPDRLARKTGLPVEHVVVAPADSSA